MDTEPPQRATQVRTRSAYYWIKLIVESIDTELGSITLRGENDEEKKLLERLGNEGVKVWITGSVTGIITPKTQGEIAVYLGRVEQAAIAYALGLADYALVDLDVGTRVLLQKIIK